MNKKSYIFCLNDIPVENKHPPTSIHQFHDPTNKMYKEKNHPLAHIKKKYKKSYLQKIGMSLKIIGGVWSWLCKFSRVFTGNKSF